MDGGPTIEARGDEVAIEVRSSGEMGVQVGGGDGAGSVPIGAEFLGEPAGGAFGRGRLPQRRRAEFVAADALARGK